MLILIWSEETQLDAFSDFMVQLWMGNLTVIKLSPVFVRYLKIESGARLPQIQISNMAYATLKVTSIL